MAFLDLVKQRYSCRNYSPRSVPAESIERCLEAARLSPSACNSQPWEFIVITDSAIREQIAQKAFSGMYSMCSFAKEAPILVAVVRKKSLYFAQMGGWLRGVKYSLIDVGIAGEHFVLQAAEEGLGTCWLGWFDERHVKRVLGLSRRDKIDSLISVGYPKDPEMPEKNRKTLAEMSAIR